MSSAPVKKLNIRISKSINYISRKLAKNDPIKKDLLSTSDSQLTNDKTTNSIQGLSPKIPSKKINRSLSSNFLNKKSLLFEQKLITRKQHSQILLCKIENKEKNKNVINIEKKVKNVSEIKAEKNINIVIKKNENVTIIKDSKKVCVSKKEDVGKNDYVVKPPTVPQLYFHDFFHENKNVFSCMNDTFGNLNENKRIPHIFNQHLLLDMKENQKMNYLKLSTNKRTHGKVLTLLYYTPTKNI